MHNESEAMQRLRIHIKESDRHDGHPLYLELLRLFKEVGLRGGTALRGIAGFGAHSELHTDRILHLTQHLPVVVEVVDTEAKLRAVLPRVDAMLDSGLVTLEPITVHRYAHPDHTDHP